MMILAGLALATVLAPGCGGDSPTDAGPAPPVSLAQLFGDTLYRADASPVAVEALDTVPVIGIFFARQGCPACEAFMPVMIDTYAQLRDAGRPFQVVLVTFSPDDATLFGYMQDEGMPWLAIPAGAGELMALVQRYDVQWVPTVVVIDSTGATLSLDGRDEVAAKGAAAYDDWVAEAGGG